MYLATNKITFAHMREQRVVYADCEKIGKRVFLSGRNHDEKKKMFSVATVFLRPVTLLPFIEYSA